MRFASMLALAFVSILSAFSALGQQTTTTNTQSPLQRDAQAVTLIQETLAAMGGAQALLLQDSVATGQAQIFNPDGTSTVLPITKKSMGTRMVRIDLQRPEGTQSRILNNGAAAVQRADGSVLPTVANNTVAERVEHIPALSILSDWANSNMELKYVGTDSVNGNPADVVSVSFVPSAQNADLWRTMTLTLFYIDQSAKFVSKMQYQNFGENDTSAMERAEIFFSNYQVVSGVSVPFKQSTYSNGRLLSTITLTSVTFHMGITSSDFNVPVGN